MFEYRAIEVDVRKDGPTHLDRTLATMAEDGWQLRAAPAVAAAWAGDARVFLIFEREKK